MFSRSTGKFHQLEPSSLKLPNLSGLCNSATCDRPGKELRGCPLIALEDP